MSENSCLLIDTHIPKGFNIPINQVKELWDFLCASIKNFEKISVDLSRSRIVDNIQRKDYATFQFFINKIPDDYMTISAIIAVTEEYFVKQNIMTALPVSIRGMCEVGSHIKIYNLI